MDYDKEGNVKGGFLMFGKWWISVRGIYVNGGNDKDEKREDDKDKG